MEDLEEQFNENIYPIPIESAQEKILQHEIENRANELLKVGQGSHALLDNTLFEDEVLIMLQIMILQNSRTDKQCIETMWQNRDKNMKCTKHQTIFLLIVVEFSSITKVNFIVPLNLQQKKLHLRFFQVFIVVNKTFQIP